MGKKESQELIRDLEIIKTATGTFLIDNGDLISNTLKHKSFISTSFDAHSTKSSEHSISHSYIVEKK